MSKGVEGEKHGGELPPPVQTSVPLICSISTITSPATGSIIMSGVIICIEEQALVATGEDDDEKRTGYSKRHEH